MGKLKMSNKENDPVNHPSHYTQGNIEVIEVIEAWDYNIGFCVGNAIKYIARHRHKGKPIEDLEKAKWYIDRLIKFYTENT